MTMNADDDFDIARHDHEITSGSPCFTSMRSGSPTCSRVNDDDEDDTDAEDICTASRKENTSLQEVQRAKPEARSTSAAPIAVLQEEQVSCMRRPYGHGTQQLNDDARDKTARPT
jgi:hypothetical protein